jgi:ribosomal protein S18 acetylase RimI-like enzyme
MAVRIAVREARKDDVAAIARVHVESWQTTYRGIIPDQVLDSRSPEQRAQRWASTLLNPSSTEFVYVAEDGSRRVVGFASGGPERTGNPQFLGELYALYLLALNQRQGIGRRLTYAAVERLHTMGLTSLLVWVLADNPACRFYEALGGQRVAVQQIELGGIALEEVAYGWPDTTHLTEA